MKIGYQAGLKLLRAGAHLIVTTRFARDSAARYSQEPDFEQWGHRLEVFGLDLRHTPSVEAFCRELSAKYQRLDFIINNACQTVRRPPEFYAHMMEAETAALRDTPEHVRKLLGSYEGLRSHDLLPEASAMQVAIKQAAVNRVCPRWPASPTPPNFRRCRCWPRNCWGRSTCSPKAGWTRTCSRSTCAAAIRGACRWPKCRRSSCWRCNWSMPSHPSSSTRASSR